jgi:Sec-independent protein translocase protein TatA
MFGLGPAEMVVIGFIIVILFGAGFLKSLPETIRESRKALKELRDVEKEFEDEDK